VPNFVSLAASVAELADGEKSRIHSLTHPAYLMPREPKFVLWNIGQHSLGQPDSCSPKPSEKEWWAVAHHSFSVECLRKCYTTHISDAHSHRVLTGNLHVQIYIQQHVRHKCTYTLHVKLFKSCQLKRPRWSQ